MVARLSRDVDIWSIYQHRTARGVEQRSAKDTRALKFADEVFDRLFNGDTEQTVTADLLDPKLATWAQGVHKTCDGLPTFHRLAAQVQGTTNSSQRAALAGHAVEQLMYDLGPLLREEEKSADKPDVPGGPPKVIDPGAVKKAADTLRRKVRTAVQRTQDEVDELVEALDATDQFGWQPGNAAADHTAQAGEHIRQIASQLKSRPNMKRLVELIGRFRRIAANKIKQKVNHGRDEVSDIEQGDDIGRFLPTELAMLNHPVRKLDLMRRIVERGVLQYKMTGQEPKGKGPMIVCLDKSGSMTGEPNDWATAVAMAMGDIAGREGRVFSVLSFDTRIMHEATVKKGEKLPLGLLDVGCGGGTSINVAYARALKIVSENPGELNKADIVMITDGGSECAGVEVMRAQAAQMGVSSIGIAIGVSADCLLPWCDTVETVNSIHSMDDKLASKLFA